MLGDCPSCGAEVAIDVFYEQRNVPIHSCQMVSTREEALSFPVGDLCLAFCPDCGFIWNVGFQPARMRYSASYEETQAFSPHFRRFQTELVDRWIDRHGLRNRRLLEIGCGKGDFLVEMCERGENTGMGIDPSYRPDRTHRRAAGRTTFLRDLYKEEHTRLRFDFVCCRHTLEHVSHPRSFVQRIRRQAEQGTGAVVAFDLPDVERVLAEQAFWDLYYEHCSYFSLGSLGRLLRSLGLEILDLCKDYDDQFLVVEARAATQTRVQPHPAEEPVGQLARLVNDFRERIGERLARWDQFIRGHHLAGRRVAVWGSGSKAVAFLTRLSINSEIATVVDINPHKHGKFLAGTGQEIVSPERLRQIAPDVVIAMNPVYLEEIGAELHQMELDVELVAL